MFDGLSAARNVYLAQLRDALGSASSALADLNRLEDESPVGSKGAWNYALFLLGVAVEAVTEAAERINPVKGSGR